MPGRSGFSAMGGWGTGGTTSTGLPNTLTVDTRVAGTPEYKAGQSIEFTEGFQSTDGDAYTANISNELTDGSGGTVNGVDGVEGLYRYGFNGKENDNEVKGEANQQDYGMRIYDPRLGKFLSVDPLQENYPELTPFQFSSNSPIANIDLDGLEKKYYIYEWKEKTGLSFVKVVTQNYDGSSFGGVWQDIWNGFPKGIKGYDLKARYSSGNEIKELTYIPVVIYPGGYSQEYASFKEAMNANHKNIAEGLQAIETAKAFAIAAGTIDQNFNEDLETSAGADAGFSNATNYASKPNVVATSTDNQVAAAHNGNAQATNTNEANSPTVAAPQEAYNRVKHYGKTPTGADRKALKAGPNDDIDHTVPLVKHFYEGDGQGGKPGYQMTSQERKTFAKDRSKMTVKPKGTNRSEGGQLSQYSKEKKKQYKL